MDYASTTTTACGDVDPGLATSVTTSGQSEKAACHGCGRAIKDRWLLRAVDRFWHENCLRCSYCQCALAAVGSTLFARADLLFCRRDYVRLFGSTAYCSYCEESIAACDMVMRAKENVYHLECFACFKCQHRFCVGDRYYLLGARILCEADYEAHLRQFGHQLPTGHPPTVSVATHPLSGNDTMTSVSPWYQPSHQSVAGRRFHSSAENHKLFDDRSSGYGSPSPPCS